MSWREFSYLVNGLSGETPLGRIISIRAERDPDNLKEFTAEEKRIRSEYLRKRAKRMPAQQTDRVLENLRQAFVAMGKSDEET